MSDSRPAGLQRQAHEQAERARTTMDDRRSDASGGVSGWVAELIRGDRLSRHSSSSARAGSNL